MWIVLFYDKPMIMCGGQYRIFHTEDQAWTWITRYEAEVGEGAKQRTLELGYRVAYLLDCKALLKDDRDLGRVTCKCGESTVWYESPEGLRLKMHNKPDGFACKFGGYTQANLRGNEALGWNGE